MNFIKNEKLSSIFFIELSEILNEEVRNICITNKLVTLVKIYLYSDFKLIKAYIKIYPTIDKELIKYFSYKAKFFRKILYNRLRYRVKIIPKLSFYYYNN